MKKTSLLIFIYSTYSMNLFSAEKEQISTEKQIKQQKELNEYMTGYDQRQSFSQKLNRLQKTTDVYPLFDKDEKIKNQTSQEYCNIINKLKKENQQTIALYEEKITSLTLEGEQKDKQIAQLTYRLKKLNNGLRQENHVKK